MSAAFTARAAAFPAGTVRFQGELHLMTPGGNPDAFEPANNPTSPYYRAAVDARRWVSREARRHPGDGADSGQVFRVEFDEDELWDDHGTVLDTSPERTRASYGQRTESGRWDWHEWEDC